MEDRSIIIDNMKNEIPSDKYQEIIYSFWGVYDGHAGYRAAEICKQSLHKLIVNNRNFFEGNIPLAIQVTNFFNIYI